jgi:hypothetical protein
LLRLIASMLAASAFLLSASAYAQIAQTITFGALANKTYGAAPFIVSATASSGLPVSFASLTTAVCTVSGTTVTIVAAGTCTIQASQAGNATYAPAPNVNQSFNVAKAAQTITFPAPAAQTYGNPPFTVSATASSGLPVTFISTTTAVCTVSGTTVTIVTGGTCTIQAQQAGNANYNAAPNVNQNVTITKLSQTITFGALASKNYGDPPFTVSATASSGLPVTFISTTTAVCTVSGTTVTIVTGGTCTIQAQQAGNAYYAAATAVSQSFTVVKLAQTITFGALANHTYGDPPFTVSATASSGLAVTFSSLTTTVCTVSGTTVTIKTGGTCTIQAAQAGNTICAAAPNVSQSFTVAKVNQTITFGALANKNYGDPPFTVNATASSGLAVTFSSLTTTVCTVSGSTVTIKTGGTCTIQAAQAGNASYNAAPNVSQSFAIAPINQTITFNALANKTYGNAPFTVSATASSGLAVAFSSLTTTVCTVSVSTVTIQSGGTCTIQAAQAGNASYNPAPSVSQSFTVLRANQTITFNALASKTFGVAPFAVTATASSGLAVSFSSLTTPVCTMSGSTVTVVAAGTCTIQAAQAGNVSYNAAPSVSQSFTVAKAAQTITFAALTAKTFGAAPFTVTATASSGLAVSFSSLTTPVCTVSGNTVTIVAGGSCTIDASQPGNANYNAATDVAQSFTVSKAAQTITFNTLSGQTYGVAPFAVNATASSGLTVTFISTTTTVCTVSGNTVTIVAVGTCTIQAQQAGNGSYNAATNVNQSFTVAKASQTITFAALANQTYGAAPFTVTATASSNLAVTFSSLTTTVCTVNGTIVTLVAGGTCTIQASQAGSANYLAATAVSQSFTVGKANQTITFNALANQTYGAAPFAVSATASSGLAVTFSSITTTVCTVSGITVTLVTGGICTIQAAQAGNASYNAAPNVSQSFTVFVATQTINFAPIPAQVLGTIPPSLSATASSGLAVSFASLTAAVCTVSGTNITLVSVGACTIQASQAGNAAYAPAPSVNQSFNVITGDQFASQVMYPIGHFPWGVVAADFNGDGKLDVAVVNLQDGTVSVFLGDGAGNLVPSATYSTGGVFPENIVVGDFNGDGKLDLAIANFLSQTVAILLGNGNGTFQSPLIVNVGGYPTALAAADLNRDGKLDLVVADGSSGSNYGQTVEVLIGNGDGTFQPGVRYFTGQSPNGVAVADFNGDGKLDIAVANSDASTLSILLGNGNGTFQPAVNYPAAYSPEQMAAADLNGDGKMDLIVLGPSINRVSIFLGNGDGTFAPHVDIPVGQAPQGLAVADFNGDGKLDLAIANSFDNDISVLLGFGDGTFHAPTLFATGIYPAGVAAADLNRDGKPDLVVANYESNSVSVLLNTSSHASPASVAASSGTPQSGQVNTAYAAALAAVVRDATNTALSGEVVTFTAPGSGASGTFAGSGTTAQATTNAAGVATAPTFTANATTGSFSVVASVAGLSTSFALTNIPIQNPTPPTFTSAPPPNGAVNVTYYYTLTASGSPAPTFSVTGGALPSGLTLNSATGVISGTPTAGGTFAGTLTAANGVAPAATQAFSINIPLASQVITFSPVASQTVGTGTISLTATASSGLPVSFTSLTASVCTVVGNVVALNASGTCTIRASQPGGGAYGPAPNVDQSFSIARGTQAINVRALYAAPVNASEELFATSSAGLPVTFASLTPTVCVVSGNVLNLIAAGTCTIRASQAGTSAYNAAPNVDSSIAVVANQTITFWSPDSQLQQVSPITLSATASSGLPVTFSSLTATVCTVSGNQATLLMSGTCTIRASQAGNAYYAAASTDRSFTVNGNSTGLPLIPTTIGPFIEYSTLLGGGGGDVAFDVVVGSDGSAYVGGSVASTNFPGLSSATFTNAGLDLMFVAKINPNRGATDFVTVVGGRAPDITLTGEQAFVGTFDANNFLGSGQVEAMTIDSAGNVYVAAYGNTVDYPVRGGTYTRGGPPYIFKVTPAGSVQRVSAAIDPAVMTIRALAVDGSGGLYFTGIAGPGLATTSGAAILAIPPTGPIVPQTAPYLIKLAPGGASTAFATYLSVPGSRTGSLPTTTDSPVDAATTAYALTVDGAGNSYVTGQANATEFPVTPGSPDTTDTQKRDAFVVKVNPTGTALLFVARLGNAAPLVGGTFGPQGGPDAERATSIALAPDGGIVIGGKTATLPFRGINAFQPLVVFGDQVPLVERETGFVAKLSADGTRWLFADPLGTFGGNLVLDAFFDLNPYPVKVAVNAAGEIYAVGTTAFDRELVNLDLFSIVSIGGVFLVPVQVVEPIPNGLDGVGPNGAFVMKIAADGSSIIYSATLGSGIATGVAADSFGNAYVTGYGGTGIPMVNGVQGDPSLPQSAPFFAKINDHLTPITLVSNVNPADAAHPVPLVVKVADARYPGSIEFDDGATVLGTVPLNGGIATLSANLSVGIHRLRAVFHGSGPFDGYASYEVIQVVNQPPAN